MAKTTPQSRETVHFLDKDGHVVQCTVDELGVLRTTGEAPRVCPLDCVRPHCPLERSPVLRRLTPVPLTSSPHPPCQT